MTDILIDYAGDWWEILTSGPYASTKILGQEENWVRYQDEDMRTAAGARIANGEDGTLVWDDLYLSGKHDRVWIREVPHFQSTGDAMRLGPRGIYELIGWNGDGAAPGYQKGAMLRNLVKVASRWHEESKESEQNNLTHMEENKLEIEVELAAAETTLEVSSTNRDRAKSYVIMNNSLLALDDLEIRILESQANIAALDVKITEVKAEEASR